MQYLLKALFGPKSLTKVVGIYHSAADVAAAADKARRMSGMATDQILVLGPKDAQNSHSALFGPSLEAAAQQGFFITLVRAHFATGMAGGVAGLLLFAWLYSLGQPMLESNPLLAFIALVGAGITFGFLLGALISIRPDHVKLIAGVRRALAANCWALILQPANAEQTTAAKDLLAASGAEVLSTL